jgi:hypothetical protein
MNKLSTGLWAALAAATAMGIAGCAPRERADAPAPDDKIASLEKGLDRQRDVDAYLVEVDKWAQALVSAATPEDHDRAETTANDLEARIARVKAIIDKARSDRFTGWTPSLAAASGELDDLRDAHYRAIAERGPQRRDAEKDMSDQLTALGAALSDYRVEASSANAEGNAEVKRRIAFLEVGRQEAAATLRDLERAPAHDWPYLRRRWDRQMKDWEEDRLEALSRLKVVSTRTPSNQG